MAIAWGYAGQNIFVIPSRDAVIVVTCNSTTSSNAQATQQEGDVIDILADELLPALLP